MSVAEPVRTSIGRITSWWNQKLITQIKISAKTEKTMLQTEFDRRTNARTMLTAVSILPMARRTVKLLKNFLKLIVNLHFTIA
jgi:hypothetical protein